MPQKKTFQNLTLDEKYLLGNFSSEMASDWIGFLQKKFPGLLTDDMTDINSLDMLLRLYSLKSPGKYVRNMNFNSVFIRKDSAETLDLLSIMRKLLFRISSEDQVKLFAKHILENVNSSQSMEAFLTSLWYSRLPCNDVVGLTGDFKGESSILKVCSNR